MNLYCLFAVSGHCVEFNVPGGVIQDQLSAPCNETFPKCDRIYNSTTAYKCEITNSPNSQINFHFLSFVLIFGNSKIPTCEMCIAWNNIANFNKNCCVCEPVPFSFTVKNLLSWWNITKYLFLLLFQNYCKLQILIVINLFP